MPQDIDLTKICIRAQDKSGKWGSFTLKELLDMGEATQVYNWFMTKIMDIIGLQAGEPLDDVAVKNMIILLEAAGVVIVKLK